MPQGISPKEHRPCATIDPMYASDLAFIGHPKPPLRQELLHRLDREFDLKIWGPDWGGLDATFRGIQHREVRTSQFARVCAASKITIGCDIAHHVELYFSNRTWITLGCGGFLLTNYSPRLETIFENRKHLVWYNSTDECVELARHYLAHPEERLQIARAGCEYAHQNHTYRHRAEALVRLIHEVRREDAKGEFRLRLRHPPLAKDPTASHPVSGEPYALPRSN
jgi:spore maturation protein CgeB